MLTAIDNIYTPIDDEYIIVYTKHTHPTRKNPYKVD